jgi:hypothetical protein
MSAAARASFWFGIYAVAAGAGFLFRPELFLAMLGFETEHDVWVHALGALAMALGAYYIQAARHELVPFFRATVPGRVFFSACLIALLILGVARVPLLVLAGMDLAGAAWSWLALRAAPRGRVAASPVHGA